MDDYEIGAMMAAVAEKSMNEKLRGSNIQHNRTDWRQILANRGRISPNQMPQGGYPVNPNPPPPNYPPNYQQRPPSYPNPPPPNYPPNYYNPQPSQVYPSMIEDGSVPTEVPQNLNFVPFPRDEHGQPILPPELQQQARPPYESPLATSDFVVPDYGIPAESASTDVASTNDKFDILMKEIKALKKTINKLTRQLEKTILPKEEIVDEPDIKP